MMQKVLSVRLARRATLVAACIALALTSPPATGVALAQQAVATVRGDPAEHQEQRQRLFRLLRQAGTAAEGLAIEMDIWSYWLEAPDAEAASLINRALERRRKHDFARALMILDDLVEQAPQWSEGWNQRATVLFEMGLEDRSLADIEKVLRLEPKHFGALAGQAVILMRQGRMRVAQSILRRAVEIHPFLAERAMIVPRPGEVEPRPGERRL